MKKLYKSTSAYFSKLINGYLFIGSKKEKLFDRFVPNGEIAIVFNFAGGVELINGAARKVLPPLFIVVPYIGSIKINTSRPYDTMIVLCKAPVFSRLLKISLNDLPKGPYKEFDPFGIYAVWEKLKKENNKRRRIRIFEEFLTEKISLQNYSGDVIDEVYEEILSAGCTDSIGNIISKYDVNPRSFRRNFLKRTGINAKGLYRIARVNYVWDMMKKTADNDFYNVIFECKFFDQSHFINDFKKLVGESPRDFITRDLKQVEILSGKRS